MLLCRCVLLCTHLRDLVPRFRRHPFLDLGLESVCVCVCVCVLFYIAHDAVEMHPAIPVKAYSISMIDVFSSSS